MRAPHPTYGPTALGKGVLDSGIGASRRNSAYCPVYSPLSRSSSNVATTIVRARRGESFDRGLGSPRGFPSGFGRGPICDQQLERISSRDTGSGMCLGAWTYAFRVPSACVRGVLRCLALRGEARVRRGDASGDGSCTPSCRSERRGKRTANVSASAGEVDAVCAIEPP